MESKKQSYKKRMQVLRERGIDTNLLLSDWCADCIHSVGIVQKAVDVHDGIPLHVEFIGQCQTGCNGFPPFEIENSSNGLKKVFEKGKFPLRYKKENGIDISL